MKGHKNRRARSHILPMALRIVAIKEIDWSRYIADFL